MKIYPDFKSCVEATIDVEGIRDQKLLNEKNLGKYPKPHPKPFTKFCYQSDEYGEVVVTIKDDCRVEPLISAAKDSNLRLIEEPTETQIALRIPNQHKTGHPRFKNDHFKKGVYMYFPKPKK